MRLPLALSFFLYEVVNKWSNCRRCHIFLSWHLHHHILERFQNLQYLLQQLELCVFSRKSIHFILIRVAQIGTHCSITGSVMSYVEFYQVSTFWTSLCVGVLNFLLGVEHMCNLWRLYHRARAVRHSSYNLTLLQTCFHTQVCPKQPRHFQDKISKHCLLDNRSIVKRHQTAWMNYRICSNFLSKQCAD